MCFIAALTMNSVHQCLQCKPWVGGYGLKKKELALGFPRDLRGEPYENLYNQCLDAQRPPGYLGWLWFAFNLTHFPFFFQDFC